MKKIVFYIAAVLLFVACQTDKKGDNTENNSKKKSDVTINFDTDSGVPEFSSETDEAVSLRYNFTEGDSAHMVMDYEMVMEMMGQRMPMNMTMESDYKIKEVKDNGNAMLRVNFTRVAMFMDGPQPVNFDSDNDTEMENNPASSMFSALLNNEVMSEISPFGKIVNMNLDAIIEEVPKEQAVQMREQLESMSDQFAQNAFVALPERPVKAGDIYEAGQVNTGGTGMKVMVDMKYKVLNISSDKRYVILEPDGRFQMEAEQEGMEMQADDNTIGGWILFDMQRGFLKRSNMNMDMNVTTNQMGQEMKMAIMMHIRMRME